MRCGLDRHDVEVRAPGSDSLKMMKTKMILVVDFAAGRNVVRVDDLFHPEKVASNLTKKAS